MTRERFSHDLICTDRVDSKHIRVSRINSWHKWVQLKMVRLMQCFISDIKKKLSEWKRARNDFKVCKRPAYILPRPVGLKHGPNTPGRAEDVEGLGEAVIVNQASVYGEHSHEQDNIPSSDNHICNLGGKAGLFSS